MNALTDHAAYLRAAIEEGFGEGLDDVLLQLRTAFETLDQVEALFASVTEFLQHGKCDYSRAIQLADVGANLAFDRANLIGCALDRYRESLLEQGIECRARNSLSSPSELPANCSSPKSAGV